MIDVGVVRWVLWPCGTASSCPASVPAAMNLRFVDFPQNIRNVGEWNEVVPFFCSLEAFLYLLRGQRVDRKADLVRVGFEKSLQFAVRQRLASKGADAVVPELSPIGQGAPIVTGDQFEIQRA